MAISSPVDGVLRPWRGFCFLSREGPVQWQTGSVMGELSPRPPLTAETTQLCPTPRVFNYSPPRSHRGQVDLLKAAARAPASSVPISPRSATAARRAGFPGMPTRGNARHGPRSRVRRRPVSPPQAPGFPGTRGLIPPTFGPRRHQRCKIPCPLMSSQLTDCWVKDRL